MMVNKPVSVVYSKWAKTKVLLKKGSLSSYVPNTELFRRETLFSMLETYGTVFVKPDQGSAGQGIIRVQKLAENHYRCRYGVKIRNYASFQALYAAILQVKLNRPYIVQQGIDLLRYRNRPFDFRVMVQLSPNKTWEMTGYIGRAAHPRKIVTNYHNGGTALPLKTLLKQHAGPEAQAWLIHRMQKLGIGIARQMKAAYPGMKEFGIDFAIDRQLKPWILEVNTRPDMSIFDTLQDKRFYRKMVRYARAYGRTVR